MISYVDHLYRQPEPVKLNYNSKNSYDDDNVNYSKFESMLEESGSSGYEKSDLAESDSDVSYEAVKQDISGVESSEVREEAVIADRTDFTAYDDTDISEINIDEVLCVKNIPQKEENQKAVLSVNKEKGEITVDLSKIPDIVVNDISVVIEKYNGDEMSAEDVKTEIRDILKHFFQNDSQMSDIAEDIPEKTLVVKGFDSDKASGGSKIEGNVKETVDESAEFVNILTKGQTDESFSGNSEGRREGSSDKYAELKIAGKKDSDKLKESGSDIKIEGLRDLSFNPESDKVEIRNDSLVSRFNENKSETFESITKQTKVVLNNNEMKFSTFIRPEELGRVDFKFDVKDGKISGRIIVQSKEAADVFRSNVEELRAVFQKSNVELDKLEVTVAGRFLEADGSAGGFSSGRENREKYAGQSGFIVKTIDSIEENMVLADRKYFNNAEGVNLIA